MTFPQIDPEQINQLAAIALELNQPVDALLHNLIGDFIKTHKHAKWRKSIDGVRYRLAETAKECNFTLPFQLNDVATCLLDDESFWIDWSLHGNYWLIKTTSNQLFFVISVTDEDGMPYRAECALVEGYPPTLWLNKINEGFETWGRIVPDYHIDDLAKKITKKIESLAFDKLAEEITKTVTSPS